MDGKDAEDVHTGGGEGSERPPSRREGDLRLNKAEMGSKRVQEDSNCEVAQSCLTLCDPMDCSPPGFSIHGIFQARILE